MAKIKSDIEVKRKGDYLNAIDTKGGYVCATYSYRTKKMWGQTRCFPSLWKKLGGRWRQVARLSEEVR
jgi:hypothetical protein